MASYNQGQPTNMSNCQSSRRNHFSGTLTNMDIRTNALRWNSRAENLHATVLKDLGRSGQ